MPPQQPYQPTPPPQNNYDFIMNPAQPPRKSPMGNSLATRILVVVGGLFILAIIAAVVLNLLSGGNAGGYSKTAMLSVAQDQTELVRLATTGTTDSVSQENKNFSITVKLGMASERTKLLTYLAEKGYEPKEKDLMLKQNPTADTQLTQAKSASAFDTAYKSVMKNAFEEYRRDLSTAYDSGNDETKSVLRSQYQMADLFLAQLGN